MIHRHTDTVPATIDTSFGIVTLLRRLGKGKSGHSFLAELQGRQVVFKRMHDEPCSFYTFKDDKVLLEVQAHATLSRLGVPMPPLIGFDQGQHFLLKAYIPGHVGHEWVAEGNADETIIAQLFALSARLRSEGLNIDYFPANFVINGAELYYIDYEVNPYSDEWSLGQWGIYYWANHDGMAHFVRTGDATGINESAGSGVPIKAPFEERVERWRMKYGIIGQDLS